MSVNKPKEGVPYPSFLVPPRSAEKGEAESANTSEVSMLDDGVWVLPDIHCPSCGDDMVGETFRECTNLFCPQKDQYL